MTFRTVSQPSDRNLDPKYWQPPRATSATPCDGEVGHGVTSGVSCETSSNKHVTPHLHREYVHGDNGLQRPSKGRCWACATRRWRSRRHSTNGRRPSTPPPPRLPMQRASSPHHGDRHAGLWGEIQMTVARSSTPSAASCGCDDLSQQVHTTKSSQAHSKCQHQITTCWCCQPAASFALCFVGLSCSASAMRPSKTTVGMAASPTAGHFCRNPVPGRQNLLRACIHPGHP